MNKISQVHFSGNIEKSKITNKEQPLNAKNIPNDSFEHTNNKNKKAKILKIAAAISAAALIAVGIALKYKKGKQSSLSFDDFKKIGGSFDKGKAINKNGEPFSGKLIKTTTKGDAFVVEYENGLIKTSTKNLSDLVDKYSVKEYTHSSDGKLRQVVNKEFILNEAAKKDYDRLPKHVKPYIDKKSLYEENIISKTTYDDKKITSFVTDFAKTAEGKRRAAMTDDEISAEVKKLFDEVLDEKGIDKSLAPKIKIMPADITHGGGYSELNNVLEINPNAYRAGLFELENVLAHEGTHFEEALLRSRLDSSVVTEAAKKKLISRIYKGEADEIIYQSSFFGSSSVKTPKLSEKMKKEFEEFAVNNLYTDDFDLQNSIMKLIKNGTKANDEAQKKLLDKIMKLINDNPDFISQYSSKEEAVEMLLKYSKSHNIRFLIMTQKPKIDFSKLPKLSSEEQKRALESLDGSLETVEGNLRIGGFKIFSTQEEFNNYQFSREEVLAQLKGNDFSIKKLKSKLEQMKKDGTLTPQLEAYYKDVIDKSELTIEFKTKGQAWYKKYIESLNNPDDTALKEAVEKEWKELEKMTEQLGSGYFATGMWERIK